MMDQPAHTQPATAASRALQPVVGASARSPHRAATAPPNLVVFLEVEAPGAGAFPRRRRPPLLPQRPGRRVNQRGVGLHLAADTVAALLRPSSGSGTSVWRRPHPVTATGDHQVIHRPRVTCGRPWHAEPKRRHRPPTFRASAQFPKRRCATPKVWRRMNGALVKVECVFREEGLFDQAKMRARDRRGPRPNWRRIGALRAEIHHLPQHPRLRPRQPSRLTRNPAGFARQNPHTDNHQITKARKRGFSARRRKTLELPL